MDRTQLERARSALRAETKRGEKALVEGNMREAVRHVTMGAYYLGHMHQIDPSLYLESEMREIDDVDDARFHMFMNRVIDAHKSASQLGPKKSRRPKRA